MHRPISRFAGWLLMTFVLCAPFASAQNVQLQTFSFPSLPATSCTNTQLNVNALLLCINIAHNGNSVNVSGSTITVTLDYSLGPICLGALSYQNYSISLGMLPPGTYNVVINGVLNSSIASTLTTSLVVNSCCAASPSFVPSSNSICAGDSIFFNNTSTGATSQQWYENNVAVGTGTNYGKTYNSIGTYTIKLVVSATGCSDSITKTVTVSAPPTVDLGPDIVMCPGSQKVLDSGSGRDSVLWSDQSSLRSLVVTSPGTYYVEVFKYGCSDKDTVVVSFYNVQDVELGNDTTICAGDTLVLDAGLTGATYKWQDNSSQSTFEVYSAGTYYVTRTDTNGCKAMDTIVISIDQSCSVGILENATQTSVDVFPNPVKSELGFNVPDAAGKMISIKIADLRGGVVLNREIEVSTSGSCKLDVNNFAPGVYILEVSTKSNTYRSRWLKD